MREIFLPVLENYLSEKTNDLRGNTFASKIRKEFPEKLRNYVYKEGDRYKVKGSPGQYKNWSDCPWFAIFDTLITESAQSGYYLVYLFRKDMKGFYLSLNQGVNDIEAVYKKDVENVLENKASDYRDRLVYRNNDLTNIELKSDSHFPKLYEKGNILARYYDKANLPDDETLKKDFIDFLNYYKQLVYNDDKDVSDNNKNSNKEQVEENKQKRLHEKFDRRGDSSSKVKKRKGYKCEACGLLMTKKYGILGKEFIEAHHLKSFASLDEGKILLSIDKDFAVLCPNCHRMIHRLPDPSDLEMLKRIIKESKYQII